jgi:hypothetical protein
LDLCWLNFCPVLINTLLIELTNDGASESFANTATCWRGWD